jgi:hypothetical protein
VEHHDSADTVPGNLLAPPGSPAVRLAAFAGAVLLLIAGALVSFGIVLLAPVGTWVARALFWRGRRFRLTERWIASVGTMALTLLASVAVLLARTAPGTVERVRHAVDSTRSATPTVPPPAWVERIAPGTTAGAARTGALPTGLSAAFGLWGVGFALVLIASCYGTIGWGGSALLSYAVTGRSVSDRPTERPTD